VLLIRHANKPQQGDYRRHEEAPFAYQAKAKSGSCTADDKNQHAQRHAPYPRKFFRKLKPDITLMDLQMPGMSGLEAIRVIRGEFPAARIIVLTTYSGDVQALNAIRAGAMGYLLKSALHRELLATIRSVHAGQRHLPPEIASEIAFHAGEEPLTAREVEILQLVAAGKANKEIAARLTLSEDTVKGYMKSIFAKLGVNDRTQAVTHAIRRGIIEI
jgi:DNA-binding NarL/FixJ family response regulator